MNRAIELLEQRLDVVRHRGQDIDARCPAHDDRSASLTFAAGEHGGAVIKCHAGCETSAVLSALGMSFAQISPEPHIVATYVYRAEDGTPLWTTERWEPKTFRQRGLPPPGQRVLYHSEWLPTARANDDTVYVVEGEKDANTLAEHGLIGVCGVNGAGSWLPHYAEQLRGLDIVVISDNDDPGKEHARAVAASLDGIAAQVALTLPSFGKDITDQLAAGYGVETLVPLSMDAELGIHRLDSIREREIDWLWPGYLPAGKLCMIDGDPGDGKSVMTCDLAARFSTGAKLPDGQRPTQPCDVVMISAEDDPEDTIKPRLRVAGADPRRIHLLTHGIVPNSPFSLTRDLPALEKFITTHHVGLVTIDPLMAFIPEGVDSYRDSDVRRVLFPITQLAARTACTVLVIRHLVKSASKAISAGGGSMGFIGAARVGYLVGRHPEDERKRVLAGVKINVGPMPEPLGYLIESSVAGDRYAPPVVRWDREPLKLTAQELLSTGSDEQREERGDAREWLAEFLRTEYEGASWVEIARAGKKEGHSENTLRNVRKSVAVMQRNPIDRSGRVRRGVFWMAATVQRHLTAVPDPDDDEDELDDVDEPDEPEGEVVAPVAPTVVFRAPAGTSCDICDAEPAVWFEQYEARRCAAHNPMLYGGD